jgi:hypothetical protein
MRFAAVVVVLFGSFSCARFLRDVDWMLPHPPLPVGTLGATCETDGGCSQGECLEIITHGPVMGARPGPTHECIMVCGGGRQCPAGLACVLDVDDDRPERCEPANQDPDRYTVHPRS